MFDMGSQLEVFPTHLHLRRIAVHSDLFGRASLVREWGRIGSHGQMMVETHPDEGRAINALMKLARAKQRKGYAP